MAAELASGGGMHRDTALIEAVNSVRCFMRLVEYGVPFPTDEIGRFVGYQTDHDTSARGTSAGPLTSKYMTEALERRVRENPQIQILDRTTVIRVVTDRNRAVGVVCLSPGSDGAAELSVIAADDIILATGGAANIYADSVYPPSQSGALGLAIEAGCALNNLTEWQYGIASKKVRWNLSGSYQQVMPAYYSTDSNGVRRDFLSEYFDSAAEMCSTIFLKGYQWPFDSAKVMGSSRIDLAVSRETKAGRRVWIDFRENPSGFAFDRLSAEAREYLERADALEETPFERLMRLNPQAVEFYRSHGIDLAAEPIEIAVCAQHMNGGVAVNGDWQTNVEHLFAVGETAGTFGMYRPGGSALNSTQVGGLRAAQYIALHRAPAGSSEGVLERALAEEREYLEHCMRSPAAPQTDFSGEMSRCAAHGRVYEEIEALYERLSRHMASKYYAVPGGGFENIRRLYKYRDNLTAQTALCRTFLHALPVTGSRGGAVFYRGGEIVPEDRRFRAKAIVTAGDAVTFERLRPAPNTSYNFEQTWRRYRESHGCRSIELK